MNWKFWERERKAEPPPAAEHHPSLAEGYSPEFVRDTVQQTRLQLIELREHGRVLSECGADADASVEQLIERAAGAVERVLQNLKSDNSDMMFMGLNLQMIDPLLRLVGGAARQAASGVSGEKLAEKIENAKQGLRLIAEKFERLHGGTLHIDDDIESKGLRRTLEELAG